MRYLIKLRPLEPYAFGVENGFSYEGAENTGKGSYYACSKKIPEQTTVFGMLRYVILQNEGLVREDFRYSPEERQQMKQYIGAESFQFSASQQDFGYLKKISPVFLMDREGNYYVRNPYHNTERKQGYQPLKMSEEKITTSAGLISFPKRDEYQVKEGHGDGFYNLMDGRIRSFADEAPIFRKVIHTGNRKNGRGKEDSDESCLFKQEMIQMDEQFSFAFFAELDDSAKLLPKEITCHMGQKRSAFLLSAMANVEDDLAERVKKAFTAGENLWFYALSDLISQEFACPDAFCMLEEKQLRNLETDYQAANHARRLKRSRQYNLVKSGSVFYDHCSLPLQKKHFEKVGLNQLIPIGKQK